MFVVCAGLFRSGSTWQYQVACEIARRAGWAVKPMGFLEGPRLADFLAGPHAPEACNLYKTHHPDPIHLSLDPSRVRTLYSFRDLRDVAYSMAHKLCVSFRECVRDRQVIDQCLAADAFWSRMPGVVPQRYEDWVRDNAAAVRGVAGVLGVDLPAADVDDIAAEFALQRNRDRTAGLAQRLTAEGVDLSDRANALLHDPGSLLHWNHIRAGTVGGWRGVATAEEMTELAALCGDWLVARGYEADHNWAGEAAAVTPPAANR